MSTTAIEQSYAVAHQDTSPIDRFWAWFKENTELLASFEECGEQVVEEVETYLKAVHEDLTDRYGLCVHSENREGRIYLPNLLESASIKW